MFEQQDNRYTSRRSCEHITARLFDVCPKTQANLSSPRPLLEEVYSNVYTLGVVDVLQSG